MMVCCVCGEKVHGGYYEITGNCWHCNSSSLKEVK